MYLPEKLKIIGRKISMFMVNLRLKILGRNLVSDEYYEQKQNE